MKKLILICLTVLIFSSISAIKINEIEMNPLSTDAGNEWVELYHYGTINLEGYKLVNNDDDEIALNGSFSGYYIYIFSKQWLDNSDEKIYLYKDENLIDESGTFDDADNNDETWQLCDSWEFLVATKGEKNNCETEEEEEPEEEIEDVVEEETEDVVEEEKLPDEDVKEPKEEREQTQTPLTPEVISLTPKDIKSEDNIESLDKTDYAKYGFIAFCILMGVLLILKNKRKQKNEII